MKKLLKFAFWFCIATFVFGIALREVSRGLIEYNANLEPTDGR